MATQPPLFNSSNKVRTSFSDKTCGFSKAQMCLKKIIDIISSGSSSCEILKRTSQTSQNPISNELNCEKESPNEKVRGLFIEKRGFGIDLNLRLGHPPLDKKESKNLTVNKGFSACSGVGDGDGDGKVCGINIDCNSSVISAEFFTNSSEGECDPKEVANSTEVFSVDREEEQEEQEQEVIEEERKEFSEITKLPETETKGETEDGEQSEIKVEEEREIEVEVDEDEEEREKQKVEVERSLRMREKKNEGYLDLLVEAARLISGNFEDDEQGNDDEEKESQNRNGRLCVEPNEETQMITEEETRPNNKSIRPKRNQCWTFDFYEDFEDISPIVRSKRGRNQVLPLRYRDSVLDPWKRLTKQRSSRVSSKNKN